MSSLCHHNRMCHHFHNWCHRIDQWTSQPDGGAQCHHWSSLTCMWSNLRSRLGTASLGFPWLMTSNIFEYGETKTIDSIYLSHDRPATRAGDRLWSCCNWSIHSFSRPIRSLHFCYERINFQLRILSTSSIRNQYTNKNGLLDLCWCKCCTPLSQYRVPTTFPQSDLLIIIVSINIKQ